MINSYCQTCLKFRNKRRRRYKLMYINTDIYSSDKILEEIKWRIKHKFGSQEKFAKEFGSSRKTLNRLLNHNRDWDDIIRMCKLLDISGIQIV